MRQKKQIRFPLVMKDRNRVNSLEELRENFSAMDIQKYFLDGRLETWLRHRNLVPLAEEIASVQKDADDCIEQICHVLGIIVNDTVIADIEQYRRRMQEAETEEIETAAEEMNEISGEEEKAIFWDRSRLWLDRDEGLTELLCFPRSKYQIACGVAVEGNYVYVKYREEHSRNYNIKCYDIRDRSSKIIDTHWKPENGGIGDNQYEICQVRNHILIYYAIWGQQEVGAINVNTGEKKIYTGLNPHAFSAGYWSGAFPYSLIDSTAANVYFADGSMNEESYLVKMNLESGNVERVLDKKYKIQDICDEGVVLGNNYFGVKKAVFYDFEKRELLPLSLPSYSYECGSNMCYYKRKIYYVRTEYEKRLTVRACDLNDGKEMEIKTFKIDQGLLGCEIRVVNNNIYIRQREMVIMRRNEGCPWYRINMNQWTIERRINTSGQFLWKLIPQ